MEPRDLDLKGLREPLEDSLRTHLGLLDKKLWYKEFPDFELTPDKTNSARTIIPITYTGSKVGYMYAIVFLPGDGTGDENTCKLNEVVISPKLSYKDKPWRVIPRAKTDVIAEGFFPFFSMKKYGIIVPFAAHLDELIFEDGDENKIIPAWRLGQERNSYLHLIKSGSDIEPKVQFTTINDDGGVFGDPHAIHYGMKVKDISQVVGFLSIKDQDNPLLVKGIVDKWKMPGFYDF